MGVFTQMRPGVFLAVLAVVLILVFTASCSDGHDGGMSAECGDGIPDAGEECDDGNTTPGDGCDENCQLEPLLMISGEYDLNIDTVVDTCGFGSSPTDSPMQVDELDPTTVEIDIPDGGVGGDCNRKDFTRDGLEGNAALGAGSELCAGDRVVGRVTSASSLAGHHRAIGIVRVDASEAGTELRAGEVSARVVAPEA